jgi:hypothetical protein
MKKEYSVVPSHIWYEALPLRRIGKGTLLVVVIGCLVGFIAKPNPNVIGTYSLAASMANPEIEYTDYTDYSEYVPEKGKVQKKSSKILSKKEELIITKNKVEQLTPKTIKTEWDKFRYNVYLIAGKIKEEFPDIAATHIQIYDWSMKLMFHESRFDPNAHNSIDAQGLFQAIPSTREWLKCGTLKGKPWSYQLKAYHEYVRKSLKSLNVTQINDFGDWYYIGLYPAHADKPDNTVFGKKGALSRLGANYRCNKGLDANKDGIITKLEVRKLVLKRCS